MRILFAGGGGGDTKNINERIHPRANFIRWCVRWELPDQILIWSGGFLLTIGKIDSIIVDLKLRGI